MKKTDTNIEVSSLPRLAKWAEADPQITPWTWLYAETDMETAVAFTALFWPALVEHDGGIFLQEFFDAGVYAQWKEKLGHAVPDIERVMNHRHVGELLRDAEEVGYSNLRHLGHVLAATWRARLADAYPERQFEVTCSEDIENEEVVIAFCQTP